jgi:hypothetical protein
MPCPADRDGFELASEGVERRLQAESSACNRHVNSRWWRGLALRELLQDLLEHLGGIILAALAALAALAGLLLLLLLYLLDHLHGHLANHAHRAAHHAHNAA